MNWVSHLILTWVLFGFYTHFVQIDHLYFSFVIANLGCLIVDIDSKTSFVSNRIRYPSFLIRLFVKHRGIFHSIWIPVLIYLFYWNQFFIPSIIFKSYFSFLNGFEFIFFFLIFGYLSHLIGDSLTIMGIRPVPPLDIKLNGPIKTGSFSEFFFIFLIILFYLFWRAYL